MLDLQFLCEHLDAVAENCRNRGVDVDLQALPALREQRGQLIAETDGLRHQQKETSAKIPKASPDEKQKFIAEGKELRERITANDATLKDVEERLRDLQAQIPNMTHPDAPTGKDGATVRTWGEIPQFDFEPLDHVELAEKHDLLDMEAGSRVAGHGFYFLKNELVLLEMALVQFALHTLRGHGYTLFSTPDLARRDVLEGTG
jgi:seryl-tRNA synthetase